MAQKGCFANDDDDSNADVMVVNDKFIRIWKEADTIFFGTIPPFN
jgi:hypothetical protein